MTDVSPGGPSPTDGEGLAREVGRVVAALARHEAGGAAAAPAADLGVASPWPPLDLLCRAFALSPFERDVLLLCVGQECDAACAEIVARLSGARPGAAAGPTFGLALAALPGAHWSALTPVAPLRYWRLIELGTGPTLASGPLRIDERILHHLMGLQYLDERLAAMIAVHDEVADLAPAHEAIVDRMAAVWRSAEADDVPLPLLQLCGGDPTINRDIAARLGGRFGSRLMVLHARHLPAAAADCEQVRRLWERETVLAPAVLLLVGEPSGDGGEVARSVETFIERAAGPLIVSTSQRRPLPERPMLTFDVAGSDAREQIGLWRRALGGLAERAEADLPALAYQFDLKAAAIEAAAAAVIGAQAGAAGTTPIGQALWDSCRDQARPRLDGVVERIRPVAGWDDLVLPDVQTSTLRRIVDQLRQRPTVYGTWGFAETGERGLGLAVLFAGPSGTGKTLAAEVLAGELRLDLYRIDLSAVVDKYIGETEKNLGRVFDSAEAGGAILLFDEADALFGKRSDVKDSHDRHANIEVSYLLQRIEAYRGLAILTTNLKDNLDQAFLRRLRFLVQFPYPGLAERQRIWARAFPPRTPRDDALDTRRLAQLNIAGGAIRNVALNAAFLAAGRGGQVTMADVRDAARWEYAKTDKSLTEAELRGWD